jgi:hypothetical protein
MRDYMEFHGRTLVAVHCKGACPNTIAVKRPGVAAGAGMVKTPQYAELVIAMREPNGLFSKHETGVCQMCKTRIVRDGPQPGELEAIYAQDMEVMITNAVRHGIPMAEALQMSTHFVARQPLRALDEKGRGEE